MKFKFEILLITLNAFLQTDFKKPAFILIIRPPKKSIYLDFSVVPNVKMYVSMKQVSQQFDSLTHKIIISHCKSNNLIF